jgi:4-methylaminobutanoate oxidase (formaldehyde-forming)
MNGGRAALPADAAVVVIGGGIGGASVAYHLATLGQRNVVLLERAELSSGTTWHSTGNLETYRADPLAFEMVRYAADLYQRLGADLGHQTGYRRVGRVMYTDRPERWEAMLGLPELGRARGIEIELLSRDALRARLPIIDADSVEGAVWIPSDARVNPTDAVQAFVAAARAAGATVRTGTRALGIATRRNRVTGVETEAGAIACDAVVLAAGLWSSELLRGIARPLPLHALEHQYVITEPLGMPRDLPLFLSFDDQLYGREEVGGLMIGSLDDHAVPLSPSELPETFSFALLNERWEQFEPYMAVAMKRFPLLRSAGVRMLLNGPESFTPDGNMLLGPVPGLDGAWVTCAFNSNGIALAPAASRFVAEWILEGAPSADIAPIDVRRFAAPQCEPAYLRERVTEIPGHACRMHRPDEDYATARDVRRSPVHDELAAAGAKFAGVAAWERPLWIGASTQSAGWEQGVAADYAAGTEGVLIVDRSSCAMWRVRADRLDRVLREAGAARELAPGTASRLALPGRWGQIEGLVRAVQEGKHVWFVAPPDQETRVGEWLRAVGLAAAEAVGGPAIFRLYGPRRDALLANVGRPREAGGSRWQLGLIDMARYEARDADATELFVGAEAARYAWRRLVTEGAPLGLRVGGLLAEEALRIAAGRPAFGREATPARRRPDVGLGGSATPAAAVPRPYRARQLLHVASDLAAIGFGHAETVLAEGRAVGELTSRVRLPGWPRAFGLALVEPATPPQAVLEVVVAGQRWRLDPVAVA